MMVSTEEDNSNWIFDYGLLDSVSVPGGDLPSFQTPFQLPTNAFSDTIGLSADLGDSLGSSDGFKEQGSRKRMKSGSCSVSDSKACREKMRRDRLNDKFQELSSILEPERTPKTDKTIILSDAIRMVNQLRDEAKKLKESRDVLQDEINELKAEKNELRDMKQKLKAEKEKLEQKVKGLHTHPGFLPSAVVPSAFAGAGQFFGGKVVPFLGYPGVPMWQFTPPAAVDTTQDHVLHSPVA